MHRELNSHLDRAIKNSGNPFWDAAVSDEEREAMLSAHQKKTRIDAAKLFRPDLSIGVLKPLTVEFAKASFGALTTPAMADTIKKSFQNHSRLSIMRLPEFYFGVKARMAEEAKDYDVDEDVELDPRIDDDDEEAAQMILDLAAAEV